jgi:Tfp pilus assembly protein PilN
VRAVNLLPEQHRRRPAGTHAPKGSSYAVLGVLGVLLAMVAAYTLTSNQVKDRETKAAEASQEADRYEARVRALGAYGNFRQTKETRLASVRGLATNRFDWERFLRELSALLPEGTWLQETSASVTGQIEGAAAPTATAAPAQPGANLKGCAPSQSEVAKLMLRLREVYLVDDVQLKQSAKGEDTGGASIENCGRLLQFDVSLTFISGAPTEHEAPTGEKSVPARLGGGS